MVRFIKLMSAMVNSKNPIPENTNRLTDLRIAGTRTDRNTHSDAGSFEDYRIPTVLGNLRDLCEYALLRMVSDGWMPSIQDVCFVS